jgi:YidC/Oxa1 family membrane protein insertase
MEQRNLLLAMAFSIGILLGWNVLFPPPKPPAGQTAETSATNSNANAPSDVALPSASAPAGKAPAAAISQALAASISREQAVKASPRLEISSDRLHGSISLKGARIDDLTLSTYKETLDANSPPVTLLSPSGSPKAYFAEFGWIGGSEGVTPSAESLWEATGGPLRPGNPVLLKWTGSTGLVFERKISLDQGYMFTVEDSVSNPGNAPTALTPYALVSRTGKPKVTQLFVLHEGLLGVLGGSLKEVDYSDLMDDGAKGIMEESSTGGWIGMTDVYWLAAVIPDQATAIKARFMHHGQGGQDRFQTDYVAETAISVPAGGSAKFTHRFFGGAKEVRLLDKIEAKLGVQNFDLAIDFGWFYFLTKPFFYAIDWLYGILGNFGLAIMALTVLIKLAFFPLANKSYKSMSQMKALQPEMVKLRERYGEDRQKLNQEMMALYKEKKVNPASGCLPILIQIPVFFSLYKVLIVTIEMRHAPFFGWIQDLSAPDPTSVFNLFGLLPYDPSAFIPGGFNIGAWALAMGLTMFFQQRLNPQPTDPIQAKIFSFMPIIFTFLLASFAAGLVIYWTWNNLLSIAQQAFIMKRQGVPIGRRAHAKAEAAKKSNSG